MKIHKAIEQEASKSRPKVVLNRAIKEYTKSYSDKYMRWTLILQAPFRPIAGR